MASTNQSPEYQQAEKHYLQASSDEERLVCLEEMIRQAPKHKSGESMRANLKTRYIKLKEKLERIKKTKKSSGKAGIKKAELQAVLIGLANSGKSSILSSLTNANPEISSVQFTTKTPIIGTLDFQGVKIQLVDMPAVESEYFDSGIANTSDVLLIVITNIEELNKISPFVEKAAGNRLIIFNKFDILTEIEKRKTEARLKSNKLDYVLFSSITRENSELLKEKIFQKFNKIRIYTKQPKQQADKDPVIASPGATVKELADKIFHGFSASVKEARVTGPSSKFPNQKVGLEHILKDKDIVEFHTK
ncbi:MAG: 50S ribosome-binding GTPase [Nanoarchaeota archaeon]|nr:50S ribosome-binding GTPase [Nanoarchaeota archaeon]MBU4086234.1 50S ribosome-binding GTPase [Nanoarchaeota archaeon]